MIKLFFLSFILFFLSACSNENKKITLDGKQLIQTKCATCHDLSMPPLLSDNELAPPMMAVSFHIANFMKPPVETQRVAMATAFVVDYVREPSLEKSYCDKESLNRYGLMPSQKDLVSDDETKAIAEYMFMHYTQENLSKIQKDQAKFDALESGEKLALKYKCLGCHKINRKVVGPSLTSIAIKYKESQEKMKESIKNGSQKKWESSNGAMMPAFKNISEEELEELSKWILKLNS